MVITVVVHIHSGVGRKIDESGNRVTHYSVLAFISVN